MAKKATNQKGKGGRPKGSGGRSKVERLHGLLVNHMLRLFKHGRQAVDPKTGQPVFDGAGKPITTPPLAADVTAAVNLLKMRPNPKAGAPFKDSTPLDLAEQVEERVRLGLLPAHWGANHNGLGGGDDLGDDDPNEE